MIAFKSNMLVGSSRSSKSGRANKALASASLILQPPENSLLKIINLINVFNNFIFCYLVAFFCSSGLNPRPQRIFAALDTALSASMASSSWKIFSNSLLRSASFFDSLQKEQNLNLLIKKKIAQINYSECNFSVISFSFCSKVRLFSSHSKTLSIAKVSSP